MCACVCQGDDGAWTDADKYENVNQVSTHLLLGHTYIHTNTPTHKTANVYNMPGIERDISPPQVNSTDVSVVSALAKQLHAAFGFPDPQ